MAFAEKSTGIFFNVNGKDVSERNFDPELTLAYYLRNKLGLRGTKLGCEEGVCGSCTVVLGSWDDALEKATYRAVNACLVPLFHVHRQFIITVEGVGSREKIHPIQDRMARGHALQCGFCSPGFVMSAYALLRNHPSPTIEQINSAIRANLCRCTGYRPILEALYSFSDKGCCGGKKNAGGCCKDQKNEEEEYNEKLLTFDDFPKYDPTQEIIFPPSLRTFVDTPEEILLNGSRIQLAIPKSLEQFKLAAKRADTVISSGLITRLLASRDPKQVTKKWVTTKYVEEFNEIKVTSETVTVGSAVSIQKLSDTLSGHLHPNIGPEVSQFLLKFSSQQVANFATWTGAFLSGIRSSQSVSDLLILLCALDVQLTVLTESGDLRSVGIEVFAMKSAGDTVVNAVFSRTDERRLFCYKMGETSEKDSTVFNFAALYGNNSSRFFAGFGGFPTRLYGLESYFDKRESSDVDSLESPVEIKNTPDLSIALEQYFAALLGNHSSRLFDDIGDMPIGLKSSESRPKEHRKKSEEINVKSLVDHSGIKDSPGLKVALERFVQLIECNKVEHLDETVNYIQWFKPSENMSAGRPLANYYNERAIIGEALYVNDMHAYGAVHLGFILSSVPHAEITSVDPSDALKLEGVVGYFDINDLPGNNVPGLSVHNMTILDNAPIFAEKKVESVGQVIGVIAAEDVLVARRAAKLVRVEYKELHSLVDFKAAREAESYLQEVERYGKSEDEVNECIGKADKVLEGEVDVGGQEHFYMETQSSLVIPGEADEMVIHSSTQAASFTQLMVSEMMNVPENKIIVKTKRMGGAFGGKVNNAAWIAGICAVVARKLKRPVYGFLSREDDIVMTGKRHPAHAKYRVGIDSEGRVQGIHYKVWLDGGWSKDVTEGVLMVMGFNIGDVYKAKAARFEGFAVKTNTISNTGFRGYGNPQAKMINENIMRRIAFEVKKDVEEVKRLNFAVEGEKDYLDSTIRSDALVECWDHCMTWSEFEERKKKTEEFNKNSKSVKRGIAMSSVRFGLPQPGDTGHGIASLLINIDGSISLTIGGTEMGQGLNQKMMQVCSEALQRPMETITIIDTSTDKIANEPETGGSQNPDTNGMAVLKCCQTILSKLQPVLDRNDGDWNKAVHDAYKTFVPLQCIEYGYADHVKMGIGEFEYPYYTTGACAVEMEVDTRTGYNRVIRVDMVMDAGHSLNPAIDIGQIEGAFMQGYGLVTCEKVTFDKVTGQLDQNSAWKYKIPKAANVPKDFRVKLLGINKVEGAQVYSSKGVGEPPLMMSCGAVHSAMMKCIESARQQNGLLAFPQAVSPLYAEKVVELCSKP